MHIPPGLRAVHPLARCARPSTCRSSASAASRIRCRPSGRWPRATATWSAWCGARSPTPTSPPRPGPGATDDIRLCLSCNQECVGPDGPQPLAGLHREPADRPGGRAASAMPGRRPTPKRGAGGRRRPGRAAGRHRRRPQRPPGHGATSSDGQAGGQVRLAATRAQPGRARRPGPQPAGRVPPARRRDRATASSVAAGPRAARRPDAVVVATGAEPARPWWAPADAGQRASTSATCSTGARRARSGDVVVIDEIGFHQATSVAELLADRGCAVEIVTTGHGRRPGPRHHPRHGELVDPGRRPRASCRRTDLVPMGIEGGDAAPAAPPHRPDAARARPDWVVLAVPANPVEWLYHELQAAGVGVDRVGDCVAPRRAHAAVVEASGSGRRPVIAVVPVPRRRAAGRAAPRRWPRPAAGRCWSGRGAPPRRRSWLGVATDRCRPWERRRPFRPRPLGDGAGPAPRRRSRCVVLPGLARRPRPGASAGRTRSAGRCWPARSRCTATGAVAWPAGAGWPSRTSPSTGRFVATLQPGVRGVERRPMAPSPTVRAASTRRRRAPTVARRRRRVEVLPPDPATMDLAEAPRIVAGGAGLDSAAAVRPARPTWPRALGASLGATRVVTDAGWVRARAPDRHHRRRRRPRAVPGLRDQRRGAAHQRPRPARPRRQRQHRRRLPDDAARRPGRRRRDANARAGRAARWPADRTRSAGRCLTSTSIVVGAGPAGLGGRTHAGPRRSRRRAARAGAVPGLQEHVRRRRLRPRPRRADPAVVGGGADPALGHPPLHDDADRRPRP